MNLLKIAFCLFMALLALPGDAYRILAIFPFNSKSHSNMLIALAKGLAVRGHTVDVIAHFPLKNPPKNYNHIINLDGHLDKLVNNFTINHAMRVGQDAVPFIANVYGNQVCDMLGLKEMQTFIASLRQNPKAYDVLVTEAFGANCYMGFGHFLKVPVVALSTTVEMPWITEFIANCDNLAVVPSIFTHTLGKMEFWERVKNVVLHYRSVYRFNAITEKRQTEAMRKYIQPDMPNIREIERNIALTLVNTHPLINGVKPLTASLIQVAGLHVEENDDQFSPGLKQWMDESKNGVVYFTLGSMVIIETLPIDTLNAIYASFAKIAPIRVLMKIADKQKLPPGLPENVRVSSWIPQVPVLAHNNTLAFITHGGLMSTQEAFYYGVPLIGIPIFGDQPRNIALYVRKKTALMLRLNEINEETFDAALNAILTDPTYRDNAKLQSRLFRDRPMSAMDTAIFWIEYVIRNGEDILKSPALELSWWQVALLDVYAFILACLISAVLLVLYILNFLYKILVSLLHPKSNPNKKTN